MKKLLSSSFIIIILLIFWSCCVNNNKPSLININSDKNKSTLKVDSTNNQLIEIEHKAPNQDEIDSIKRIKTLNKK